MHGPWFLFLLMLLWPEYAGKPQKNSCLGEDDSEFPFSNVNKTKANGRVPIDKPVRDGVL